MRIAIGRGGLTVRIREGTYLMIGPVRADRRMGTMVDVQGTARLSRIWTCRIGPLLFGTVTINPNGFPL